MENLYLLTTENIILLSVIVFFSGLLLVKIILKDRIKFIWQISFSILLVFYFGLYIYAESMINGDDYTKRDFDEELWGNDRTERISMVDDLIESEILIDKTPETIIKILGSPSDYVNDTLSYLEYDLGYADVGINQSLILLKIHMESGVTIKAERLAIHLDW